MANAQKAPTGVRVQPVVLSGGSGTRLWPLSREKYPKQLLPLIGEDSLLQATVRRTEGIGTELADPMVVCNEEYRFVIAEQLRLMGKPGTIVLEPVGRNTAPALTLAALAAAADDARDPVLLVMPADHVILDTEAFRIAVRHGARLAAQGMVVTFGITPDAPETGYGYIQTGEALGGDGQLGKPLPADAHIGEAPAGDASAGKAPGTAATTDGAPGIAATTDGAPGTAATTDGALGTAATTDGAPGTAATTGGALDGDSRTAGAPASGATSGGQLADDAAAGPARLIARFVEKPDLPTAQAYLDEACYLWNSGIFMLRASVWLAAIGRCRADILQACESAWHGVVRDGDFARVGKEAFAACPSDSIDYAVMERITSSSRAGADAVAGLPTGVVIPLQAGWSDVGAWDALWKVLPKDDDGNVGQGDVMLHDCRNTLALSDGRLVACVGVSDLVVVETPDAVLVAHKDHTQDVKKIVDGLKKAGRLEGQTHRKVFRPWGWYDSVDAGARFQVKRIVVKPGGTLSLQMHHHRAEHWIVVTGTARVTRGEESFLVSENESTYIPLGTTHRLENPGRVQLEMIEVQSGTYLGEDDIVRLEDVYGR